MRRIEVLMAVAVVLVAGTVLDSFTAQPASRYLLTVAVVDDGTVELDRYASLLQVDQARQRGHVYSDKAPYQPLLATVPYAGFRWLGGDAFPEVEGRPSPNAAFHWGRWWVGLWSAAIPGALLCLVFRRLAAQVRPTDSVAVALALSFGTMLLPLSSALFGHVLSALLLGASWALLRPGGMPAWRLLVAGVLLAGAVGTEFPAAIPAAVVLAVSLRRLDWTGRLALLGGGGIGSVPLLVYNWVAFGSPIETAYQGNLTNFEGSGALGVYNLVWPQAEELRKAMIGDRGLLTLTPICLVALFACVQLIWSRSPLRRDAVIAIAITAVMWVVSAGIDGYGGSSPGPRYLVPVIPFLVVPLAAAWQRVPAMCWVAAVAGAVPMIAATATVPLVDTDHGRAVRLWFDRIGSGQVAPSVLGELLGPQWLWLAIALGLAAAVTALALHRAVVQRAGPQ